MSDIISVSNLVKKFMEIIARVDPLTYGIDGVRGALITHSSYGMLADGAILIVITVILLGLGSFLFERIQV